MRERNALDESVAAIRKIESDLDDGVTLIELGEAEGDQDSIAEGEETIKERADPDVKDAALIAAAQRVEHYEMAAYGTVCAYAKQLKLAPVLDLLKATMSEEVATDKALSGLAEGSINLEAQ